MSGGRLSDRWDLLCSTSQSSSEFHVMSHTFSPSARPFRLQPGRNCWRRAAAERLAFLIDGASYFDAFYRAALNAERSIMILSWDIDTDTRLLRHAQGVDEMPTELGPFLLQLLRRKRHLRVSMLNWDCSMLYGLDRQWFPSIRYGWRAHRRLEFQLNDRQPVGASQHEKLVVIDDTVAFIGGLDLTKHRWDTSEHQEHEPHRVDPEGNAYPPFHDVQVIVAGEVAEVLGDLARLRWREATGRTLPMSRRRSVTEVWPAGVRTDLSSLSVAVARTQPSFEDQPEAREIEHLYLDAIEAARSHVFLESQYVTSHRIGEALGARLSEVQGPEVVIVTRRKSEGWLEHHTMDALRARLIRQLREAAKPDRFRVYWPTACGMSAEICIGVHSKLLMVDDTILTIGSANCSNRSMGLDTECNLVIDGTQNESVQDGLRRLRHRLLGEHLGRQFSDVEQAERRVRSMVGVIEQLNGGTRRLEEYSCGVDDAIEQVLPPSVLVDPERPVDPDQLWRIVGGLPQQGDVRRHAAIFLASCVLLGGLGLLWRWIGRYRS